MVGAVVVGAVVVGAVVAGGVVGRGVAGAVRVGRGDTVVVRSAPPGVAEVVEVAGARDGTERAAVGAAVAVGVAVAAWGVDGAGDGFRCSAVASTNGMTASGVIGPPAKLIPTSTV